MNPDDEIRIGISAGLLGEKVRFDGGHKRDSFIVDTVGSLVRFVPVCPEVEIGLGTPRETLRLERSGKGVRMVAPKSGTDHTATMTDYGKRKAKELGSLDLCGFILKKDSPSCGMERVRVFDKNGLPSKIGRGVFAEQLIAANPELPVEEERRLCDPRLRESFFERVFAFRRLKALFSGRWSFGQLVAFHTNEKFLLLAHDRVGYGRLGRLVADGKKRPRSEVATNYRTTFMATLKKIATVKKHRNVLQHIAGHLKKVLTPEEKAELHGHINDFAAGLVPLIVPITLIRHLARRHNITYLDGQTYLEPHSKELMLRNYV